MDTYKLYHDLKDTITKWCDSNKLIEIATRFSISIFSETVIDENSMIYRILVSYRNNLGIKHRVFSINIKTEFNNRLKDDSKHHTMIVKEFNNVLNNCTNDYRNQLKEGTFKGWVE